MNKLLLLLIVLASFSCKKSLDERDQLFLDFAWQEDLYQSGFEHRYLDLPDIEAANDNYLDETLSVEKLIAEIKQGKLIKDYRDVVYPSKDGKILPFPCRIIGLEEDNFNTRNTELEFFYPDTVATAVFTKDDIGEGKMVGGIKLKLLEMKNDCSIFLLEDMTKRYDYSYTAGLPKERTDETDETEEPNPLYYKYSDYINDVYSEKNDTQIFFNVIGESKALLNFDLTDTDFRHYLWYRNQDMPYESMLSDYQDIKTRYKELDENPDMKYHPTSTIFIRSFGNAEEVKVSWKSSSGKWVKIDLGEKKIEPIESIIYDSNIPEIRSTEEDIYTKMKVHLVDFLRSDKTPSRTRLYATLPSSYDTQSPPFSMSFEDIVLYKAEGDSVVISEDDIDTDIGSVGIPYEHKTSRNIAAESFGTEDFVKIRGNIRVHYTVCSDSTYTKTYYPEGFPYLSDNMEAWVTPSAYKEIYFYDKDGKELSFDKLWEGKIPVSDIHSAKVRYELDQKDLIVPFEIVPERKKKN